jgi:hypothetical protein
MKRQTKREAGQSIIIIAFALVALLALTAFVVDAGNAYAQERQMQNAVDAGSQAGALAYAQNMKNGQIVSAITNYVQRNGVDPSKIKAYYVVQDAQGNNIIVRDNTIDSYGLSNSAPKTLNVNGVPLPVVGVQVEGTKTFPTYFAGIVGWKQMQVGGGAASYAMCGASSASGLFPIALSADTFTDENGDGIPDVHFEQTDPTYTYRIWENKQTAPGNFGYLSWNGDPSETTLVANMQDPSRSGPWSAGDNIPGATGTIASSNVQSALQQYVNSGTPVTIPVFDSVSGTGKNATYHIKGFARFRITAFGYQGSDKYIDGKFQLYTDPSGDGGAANYGVCSVKVRPPIDTQRVLAGTVKIQQLTPVTGFTQQNVHVPVDVVNVLDISGSMNDPFGSTSKIQAAKDALTAFNNNMQPSLGDQVALVTFPEIDNRSSNQTYYFSCTQTGSTKTYYWAQQNSGLTTNISGVNNIIKSLSANGGTPLAAGLQQARQTVLGNGHQSNHVAVIILASDGLTNIRLNGKWTGFQGSKYFVGDCNSPAVMDALDQANIAKGDTNPPDGKPDTIIFTIALGNDFDPQILQSVASPDTNPSQPHYFRVTDANSMKSIYQQIAQRVQNIGSETCQVIETDAFASGASVVVKNQNTGRQYTLQTTSAGEFVLPNADPGTYQFLSASVTINGFTYNVFTDGVGGPDLTSNPTVDVGIGSGTYKTDLALRSSTTPTCGH